MSVPGRSTSRSRRMRPPRRSRRCECALARCAAHRFPCGSAPVRPCSRWKSRPTSTCRSGFTWIRRRHILYRIRAGTARGCRRAMNSKCFETATLSPQCHNLHRRTGPQTVLTAAMGRASGVRFRFTCCTGSMRPGRTPSDSQQRKEASFSTSRTGPIFGLNRSLKRNATSG